VNVEHEPVKVPKEFNGISVEELPGIPTVTFTPVNSCSVDLEFQQYFIFVTL